MNLHELAWPQVEEYLKKNSFIIIPVGSTEQHGPTGLIGTDYLTANAIATQVGLNTNLMVAPPLCYGMALHHLDFPGTMALRPTTYIQVIKDLVASLTRNGFTKFVFLNGHGGNIAPLTTAFSEIKSDKEELLLEIINWWHLPEVREYEEKAFGDSNGFHATCGEVAVTMKTNREAFKNIPSQQFTVQKRDFTMPMSPYEFRQNFPDGRMFSNPGLSSEKHGEKIFELAVQAIEKRVRLHL